MLSDMMILRGEDWKEVYRAVNRLLSRRVPVYWVMNSGGVPPGTFLIAADRLGELAGLPGVDHARLAEGGGERLVSLSRPRIGVYGGGGAPYHHAALLAELGFEIDFVNDVDIRQGVLDACDALLVPGGGWRAMFGQLQPLGGDGIARIAEFVRRGGLYLGSCAGSYDVAITPANFLEDCPIQVGLQMVNALIWNRGDEWGGIRSPGIGVLKVKNSRPDHPVMFGLPDEFEIVHYNGPMFEPAARSVENASAVVELCRFSGVTERFTPAERFVTGGPTDTLLVEQGIEAGTSCGIAGEYGRGLVVVFGSHPEFGQDLTMTHWSDPARLFANAVFYQSARRQAWRLPSDRPRLADHGTTVPMPVRMDDLVASLAGGVRTLLCDVRELRLALLGEPRWLTADYSMSMFGMDPLPIWNETLEECEQRLAATVDNLDSLRGLHEETRSRLNSSHSRELAASLATNEVWMLFRRPDEWEQDGGFQGLEELICHARELIRQARARLDDVLPPPTGQGYSFLFENPYHLAVGSYLAASGFIASLFQLTRTMLAQLTFSLQAGDKQD